MERIHFQTLLKGTASILRNARMTGFSILLIDWFCMKIHSMSWNTKLRPFGSAFVLLKLSETTAFGLALFILAVVERCVFRELMKVKIEKIGSISLHFGVSNRWQLQYFASSRNYEKLSFCNPQDHLFESPLIPSTHQRRSSVRIHFEAITCLEFGNTAVRYLQISKCVEVTRIVL